VQVLLDTCALLWLVGEPARLSARARAALESSDTEAYVSAISGFEISVKHKKGKLVLPIPPREWLAQAFAAYSLRELPITLQIAALAPEVAVSHADPCDRMIVATAQLHGMPLMTSDHLISACSDITILW
jgi:PIN domain nuclease of toxin-antitoxin system